MTDTELLEEICQLLNTVGTKGLQAIVENYNRGEYYDRDLFMYLLRLKSVAGWYDWWSGYLTSQKKAATQPLGIPR